MVGLGMCAVLCKEKVMEEMRAVRLPVNHSHHFVTDGFFSVLEEWLTAGWFPGCATVWDVIVYLRFKLANSPKYARTRTRTRARARACACAHASKHPPI